MSSSKSDSDSSSSSSSSSSSPSAARFFLPRFCLGVLGFFGLASPELRRRLPPPSEPAESRRFGLGAAPSLALSFLDACSTKLKSASSSSSAKSVRSHTYATAGRSIASATDGGGAAVAGGSLAPLALPPAAARGGAQSGCVSSSMPSARRETCRSGPRTPSSAGSNVEHLASESWNCRLRWRLSSSASESIAAAWQWRATSSGIVAAPASSSAADLGASSLSPSAPPAARSDVSAERDSWRLIW
mmetsp:Transcript_2508/g.6763  ORF Transcript_2508/g.6763 Transcript_2508/m.6763 type:complete len:245 (+) Transcript_2508:2031-2765(+)